MTRAVRHYLFDILEQIAFCERLVGGRPTDVLETDVVLRMAVERALEIVSEASRHIPDGDKASAPEVPWRQIADLGNRLRHAYPLTDVDQIHVIATKRLNELKPVIERLYEKHKRPADPWPDADPETR